MSKVFLIVIAMMSSSPQSDTDLYIIQDPNFNNAVSCSQFIQINTVTLIQKANIEYPNREVEHIICIEEEKLKVLISGTQA